MPNGVSGIPRLVAAAVLLALSAGSAAAQKVPSPEEFLGFKVGADYKLATYTQAYKYFKALEQASPMIKVFEMGKTPMGHPFIYAVITSPENMAKLDRYRDIARRLSLVKGVSEEEARKLAAEGRAVVYIDGGLHASECAPAQQNIQLAYDLVSQNDAMTTLIRQNVILVLVFANPDGMESLAEWYAKNIGTPYEVSGMPWVYNKYSGHDNNRDSYMANLVETQYLTKIVNQELVPAGPLQPAPDGAVPGPHLGPPRVRTNQPERAPPPDPLAEPARVGDGFGVRPRGQAGRNLAHHLRHVVPGLRHPDRGLPQHRLAADRDGAVPVCHAQVLHARRLPRAVQGLHRRHVLSQPLEGRMVAAARRGRVLRDGVEGRAAHGGAVPRRRCCSTSTTWAAT